MRLKSYRGPASRRGSLLVPIVAAITILSLSGIVLSQTFSAQRVQSVLAVESSRAFWIAEAGAWHAGMEGSKIGPAVTFDQGFYSTEEVDGSPGEYQGLGQFSNANRRVPLVGPLFLDSNSVTAQAVMKPIDKSTTNRSAFRVSRFRFDVDLHSARSYPSVLAGVRFVSSESSQSVNWVASDMKLLWQRPNGSTASGSVDIDLSDGDPTLRIVEPKRPLNLLFSVSPQPFGTDTFRLRLRFTDGTTSQLRFTITW